MIRWFVNARNPSFVDFLAVPCFKADRNNRVEN